MPPNGKRKRSTPPTSHGGTQQQISAMFGDRVKKPRTFREGVPPVLKKQKPVFATGAGGMEIPAAQPAPKTVTEAVHSQKRKWRLSEIVRQDREARRQRNKETPSFVFQAPHMDTRRPQQGDSDGRLPPKTTAKAAVKKKEKVQTDLRSTYAKCVYGAAADAPGVRSHGSLAVSGGEAIMYSRSMLPNSHVMLLDVLIALEQAVSLLKTRRTLPTVAAVRDIVRRSTRRDFTIKILSQLAHVIPEAVAVLPGLKTSANQKRPSDGLIIRLDNVDPKKVVVDNKNGARLRRSLLHTRLLEDIREHHARFLKRSGINRHDSDMWHPGFDLEKDVEELPAPPLLPEELPDKDIGVRSNVEKTAQGAKDTVQKLPAVQGEESTRSGLEAQPTSDDDDCVPSDLLQKVRERAKAKEAHDATAEVEKTTNRSLLSKLPCTMDTICALLRSERRSAMGWSQLLVKVEKVHPKKWPRNDLEKQLNAITDLGGEWCKKVELKSSRGGFAFRVVSDGSFGSARSKVGSTKSYITNEQ